MLGKKEGEGAAQECYRSGKERGGFMNILKGRDEMRKQSTTEQVVAVSRFHDKENSQLQRRNIVLQDPTCWFECSMELCVLDYNSNNLLLT